MKHINLVISIIMMTFTLGCAKGAGNNNEAPEGVSQGNGMTTYASNYKYTLSYKAGLQLIIKSEREIEINDSTFIKRGEDQSSLTVKALEQSDLDGDVLNTSDDLLSHLVKKKPLGNWKKVQQPGSLGFYSESMDRNFTNTDYYFFSEEKNVIYGHMVLANNSINSQYIKSIMSTFALDYTSPTISDIKLENSTILSGDYATILFKASDDLSGLNLDATSIYGFFALDEAGGGSEFRLNGVELKALGDSWYSVKFKVESYLKSGNYNLISFCIADNVGNRLALAAQSESYCRSEATMTLAPIPPITLKISNPALDILDQPRIIDIKLEKKTLKAGEQGTILFKAVQPWLATNYMGLFSSYDTEGIITIDTRKLMVLANDWYSVKFTVNKNVPKGNYALVSFVLRDSVGIKAALWGRHYGYYAFQDQNKNYTWTTIEMVTLEIK